MVKYFGSVRNLLGVFLHFSRCSNSVFNDRYVPIYKDLASRVTTSVSFVRKSCSAKQWMSPSSRHLSALVRISHHLPTSSTFNKPLKEFQKENYDFILLLFKCNLRPCKWSITYDFPVNFKGPRTVALAPKFVQYFYIRPNNCVEFIRSNLLREWLEFSSQWFMNVSVAQLGWIVSDFAWIKQA